MCMVVLPSGVMVNQMDGVKLSPMAAFALLPVNTAERTRNSRRVSFVSVISGMAGALLHDLRGALDRTDDPRIGGAAAQIPVHAVHDLFVGWIGVLREQRGRLHDLAGLAIAALRHLLLD